MIWFLSVYVLTIFWLPQFVINQYQFFPDNMTSVELDGMHYDDQRDANLSIPTASIPSMSISNQYIHLFIRYNPAHNTILNKLCIDYEPSKKRSIISGITISSKGFQIGDKIVKEENPKKLLNCLAALYEVYLDDCLYLDLDYSYEVV